jgi:hypothetical protein
MLPGLLAIVFTSGALVAQEAQGPAAPPRHPSPGGMSQATLDEMLIRFPLPPGQEAYVDIDGRQMHKYVIEQVNVLVLPLRARHRHERVTSLLSY